MPTEVILLHNIPGLGAEGDRVRVADGYARNFLFPARLASPPEAASARRLEALKRIRAGREATERKAAEDLAKKLKGLVLTLALPTAQEGKAFGSVTAADIAEEAVRRGLVVDRKQMELERPLHAAGEYTVKVHLHPEIVVPLKIVVTAEEVSAATAGPAEKRERPGGKKARRQETLKATKSAEAKSAVTSAKAPKRGKAS